MDTHLRFTTLARMCGLLVLAFACLNTGCASLDDDSRAAADPFAGDPDEVILRVNGEPITRGEQHEVMREIIAFAPPQITPDRIRVMMPQIRRQAREQLLEQALIDQTIEAEGIEPTAEQIDRELQAMRDYFEAYGSSLDRYMREEGVEIETVRADIRHQLARNMLFDRRLGIEEPTEAEKRAFFEQYREQFIFPEAVHLHQILIALPGDPPPDREMRIRLRDRAETARQRVLADEDFARVARDVSEGPAADQGGDLGWVVRESSLPVSIVETAFDLEPGEVSQVVESPVGHHILMVSEKRQKTAATFDQVDSLITSEIMSAQRQEGAQRILDAMKEQAEIVDLTKTDESAE